MNRNKATHSGHCQICGAEQKLPVGVLAKHGYTTKWGFFSGTCAGSGYQPFEQATDRILAAIERTEQAVYNFQKVIATLQQPITDNKAPFQLLQQKRLRRLLRDGSNGFGTDAQRKILARDPDPPRWYG